MTLKKCNVAYPSNKKYLGLNTCSVNIVIIIFERKTFFFLYYELFIHKYHCFGGSCTI